MKTLVAALALLAWVTTPAAAYVVEVTTTVPVTDVHDNAALRHAVQSAVDDVLKDAIAFTPTLIVVTRAMVLGDRLWLHLLVADRDGEQAVGALTAPSPDDERDGDDAANAAPADLQI